MILNKIEDPRSNLDKTKRRELVEGIRALGVEQFEFNGVQFPLDPWPPAIIMRAYLRGRGVMRVDNVPVRTLGSSEPSRTGRYENKLQPSRPTSQGVDADTVSDLARQWPQQALPAGPEKPQEPVKPVPDMTMAELRKACKARGIPMARKDNMESLRAKLNG